MRRRIRFNAAALACGLRREVRNTQSHLFVLFHFEGGSVFRFLFVPHQLGSRREAAVESVCVCVQRSGFDQMCRVSRCTQKPFHQLLILP